MSEELKEVSGKIESIYADSTHPYHDPDHPDRQAALEEMDRLSKRKFELETASGDDSTTTAFQELNEVGGEIESIYADPAHPYFVADHPDHWRARYNVDALFQRQLALETSIREGN